MIWLASFPRSGNTFFRNVLFDVYGIESREFDADRTTPKNRDYRDFPVAKTHVLPKYLEPDTSDCPAIYLVRDGRDALVSMAHQRKDIVRPGSNLRLNLFAALAFARLSKFGSWSQNVDQWTERATLVIKFEELIEKPIETVERLRAVMDLPEPRLDRVPTFESQKFGNPHYGGRNARLPNRSELFFRKGKVGGWKEEMPPPLESLFWLLHGKTMERLGYAR
jgi:hypothetical protein